MLAHARRALALVVFFGTMYCAPATTQNPDVVIPDRQRVFVVHVDNQSWRDAVISIGVGQKHRIGDVPAHSSRVFLIQRSRAERGSLTLSARQIAGGIYEAAGVSDLSSGEIYFTLTEPLERSFLYEQN